MFPTLHFRTIPVSLLFSLTIGLLSALGAKPNILIILVDDAGYHDFGFMGCEDIPTPNLDQLAASGVVFTDAHVTATVCSPSRAGLLTGRYQQRFGHECNVPPEDTGMDPQEWTIGDILQSAGYKTYVFGKWHVGNRASYHPNTRGFDEFYGFLEGARSYFPDPETDHPEHFKAILHNREQVDFEGYLTDVLTDKAIEVIQRSDSQPWFVFLSYNAVHTPMEAKQEDLDRFAGHSRQQLAAMTWCLDENVGKLMDALQMTGQTEETLVFFLSDNGGAGFNNNQSRNDPLKGWKGNKYEGGHRVPFILSWPGTAPSGIRFGGLTSALDIAATALAVSGLDQTPGKPLDGVNLIPYVTGENVGNPHTNLFWRKDQMAAVRFNQYKLIRLDGFGYRLYDLKKDLGESRNLWDKLPDIAAQMEKQLIAWEKQLTVPWWFEGHDWSAVTYEIHRALMDNREPNYINPGQRTKFLKNREK